MIAGEEKYFGERDFLRGRRCAGVDVVCVNPCEQQGDGPVTMPVPGPSPFNIAVPLPDAFPHRTAACCAAAHFFANVGGGSPFLHICHGLPSPIQAVLACQQAKRDQIAPYGAKVIVIVRYDEVDFALGVQFVVGKGVADNLQNDFPFFVLRR